MQMLVDPLKLLEIPEKEKNFTSGFTKEEIFSGEKNGKDFTIKFSQGSGVIGSIVSRPENFFLEDKFPTFSFSCSSGRYFVSLKFERVGETHGVFEIKRK